MKNIRLEPDEEGRITKREFIKWLVSTLLLAAFLSFLYGTTRYYFNNVIKIGPAVFDVSEFFFILGLGAWAIISYIIFKN